MSEQKEVNKEEVKHKKDIKFTLADAKGWEEAIKRLQLNENCSSK